MSATRKVVVGAAAITIVAVVALLVAGGRGRLDGPDGTLAFQRLVAAYGGDVDRGGGPVDGATLVLIDDRRTPEEAEALLEWVEEGGRMVLAQPASEVAAQLGVAPGPFVSGSVFGTADLRPTCAAPVVVGLEAVRVRAVDSTLTTGNQPQVLGCLARDDGAPYLVTVVHGQGTVVVLGGPTALWNEHLDDLDNAVLALRSIGGPGSDVVMGDPVPASRPAPGLVAALPSSARMALVGLVLAGVTFGAVRWRRLGMPPDEPAPSPLPASSLVHATGNLLRTAEDRAFVAQQLREHHARRLGRRLGLAAEMPLADVGRAVDERLGLDQEAEGLLDGVAPRDDEALLRLARDLHRLIRRIEEGT